MKIESAWSGLMAYARHYMPQIGRTGRRAVVLHRLRRPWAQHHGGRPAGLIAAAIAEGDDRYRLFAPFGLAWNGGPLGPVAAQLTYWKLQPQDWWAERGVAQKKDRKERASHA